MVLAGPFKQCLCKALQLQINYRLFWLKKYIYTVYEHLTIPNNKHIYKATN